MPNYDAEFRTATETAERGIAAKTTAAALRTARDIGRDVMRGSLPLNEIVVRKDGEEVARWQNNDYRMHLIVPRLLTAAYAVVDNWQAKQDIAIPVRYLAKVVAIARNKKAVVR